MGRTPIEVPDLYGGTAEFFRDPPIWELLRQLSPSSWLAPGPEIYAHLRNRQCSLVASCGWARGPLVFSISPSTVLFSPLTLRPSFPKVSATWEVGNPQYLYTT